MKEYQKLTTGQSRYKKVGHYVLGNKIVEGTSWEVRYATHLGTSQQVAVKIVPIQETSLHLVTQRHFRREVSLLQRMRHPNIARMYEMMETSRHYYLVLELVSGGDLLGNILDRVCLTENQTSAYMKQLASAVCYLHRSDIVHRSLTLEHILLDKSSGNIKLVGFGLSASCQGNDFLLRTQCVRPLYAAPEICAGKMYGKPVDIWSLGVCMFAMLLGHLPIFLGEEPTLPHLYQHVLESCPATRKLSEACQDLLQKLLEVDPKLRIKADKLVFHTWFLDQPINLLPSVQKKECQFVGANFHLPICETTFTSNSDSPELFQDQHDTWPSGKGDNLPSVKGDNSPSGKGDNSPSGKGDNSSSGKGNNSSSGKASTDNLKHKTVQEMWKNVKKENSRKTLKKHPLKLPKLSSQGRENYSSPCAGRKESDSRRSSEYSSTDASTNPTRASCKDKSQISSSYKSKLLQLKLLRHEQPQTTIATHLYDKNEYSLTERSPHDFSLQENNKTTEIMSNLDSSDPEISASESIIPYISVTDFKSWNTSTGVKNVKDLKVKDILLFRQDPKTSGDFHETTMQIRPDNFQLQNTVNPFLHQEIPPKGSKKSTSITHSKLDNDAQDLFSGTIQKTNKYLTTIPKETAHLYTTQSTHAGSQPVMSIPTSNLSKVQEPFRKDIRGKVNKVKESLKLMNDSNELGDKITLRLYKNEQKFHKTNDHHFQLTEYERWSLYSNSKGHMTRNFLDHNSAAGISGQFPGKMSAHCCHGNSHDFETNHQVDKERPRCHGSPAVTTNDQHFEFEDFPLPVTRVVITKTKRAMKS